jgi:hypothetical protein
MMHGNRGENGVVKSLYKVKHSGCMKQMWTQAGLNHMTTCAQVQYATTELTHTVTGLLLKKQ